MHQDSQGEHSAAALQNNQTFPSTGLPYRIELNSQQVGYLTRLLPINYSFQQELRPLKRATSTSQKILPQTKITEPPARVIKAKEVEPPSQEEIKAPVYNKNSSARSVRNNGSRCSEQIQNAVYQKYNVQKQIGRRNSYENVSESVRPCIRILNLLKNSKTSWPFREPVDPIALGIPHYTQIVKEPMDLSTIQHNLRTNQYVTPTQFHADVSKIITNSYTFNSSNIQFTKMTAQFQAYYRKITSQPNGQLQRGYSQTQIPNEPYRDKSSNEQKKNEIKKTIKDDGYSQSQGPTISMAEKKQLGLNIKKLQKEHMRGILDIVNQGKPQIKGEFDLKELNSTVIRKLQIYVKEKLSSDNKAKAAFGQDKSKDPYHQKEESSFELDEEDQS